MPLRLDSLHGFEVSGGTPHFSKYASAAANLASRIATSASKAETLPLWRRDASAFKFLRVTSSSEKLVVLVRPERILALKRKISRFQTLFPPYPAACGKRGVARLPAEWNPTYS